MMGSEGPVVQADSTWYPKVWPSDHSGRGGLKPFPASGRSCAAVAGSAFSRIYAALIAAGGQPNSNLVPVTHIRCRITASLRATATVARFIPRRLATAIPQARSRDHLRVRVINADAAS